MTDRSSVREQTVWLRCVVTDARDYTEAEAMMQVAVKDVPAMVYVEHLHGEMQLGDDGSASVPSQPTDRPQTMLKRWVTAWKVDR